MHTESMMNIFCVAVWSRSNFFHTVVNKVTPNKAHRVHRKNQPLARGAKGEKNSLYRYRHIYNTNHCFKTGFTLNYSTWSQITHFCFCWNVMCLNFSMTVQSAPKLTSFSSFYHSSLFLLVHCTSVCISLLVFLCNEQFKCTGTWQYSNIVLSQHSHIPHLVSVCVTVLHRRMGILTYMCWFHNWPCTVILHIIKLNWI